MTDDPGIQARHAAGILLNAALDRRNGLDEALTKPPVSTLEPQDRAFARAVAMAALRRLGEIDAILDTRLKRSPPHPLGSTWSRPSRRTVPDSEPRRRRPATETATGRPIREERILTAMYQRSPRML